MALKSDKQRIYELWSEVFGDSKEVIDRFFDSVISVENIAVCIDGERIVSMLSLIPVKIVTGSSSFLNAFCVYAAATDSEYRKRGIMSRLLSFSSQRAKKRNADLLFLHPASEKLYQYYEKNGFEKAFYLIDKVHYSEISEDFTYSYVAWDKDILKLNSEFSDNLSFFCDCGYADYCKKDGAVTVNTFSGGNVRKLLYALSKETGTENIYVNLPAVSCENALPQGMIKRLNGKIYDNNIYMGITLE